jgi:hypothetical protein
MRTIPGVSRPRIRLPRPAADVDRLCHVELQYAFVVEIDMLKLHRPVDRDPKMRAERSCVYRPVTAQFFDLTKKAFRLFLSIGFSPITFRVSSNSSSTAAGPPSASNATRFSRITFLGLIVTRTWFLSAPYGLPSNRVQCLIINFLSLLRHNVPQIIHSCQELFRSLHHWPASFCDLRKIQRIGVRSTRRRRSGRTDPRQRSYRRQRPR